MMWWWVMEVRVTKEHILHKVEQAVKTAAIQRLMD
jgi:hypothetical protein